MPSLHEFVNKLSDEVGAILRKVSKGNENCKSEQQGGASKDHQICSLNSTYLIQSHLRFLLCWDDRHRPPSVGNPISTS